MATESQQGATLLEVRDLRVQFDTERGTIYAVDGVTFTINEGETLGLVGESGSGKTVLSRTIMGLLPSSSVRIEGQAMFDGEDLLTLSFDRMRKLLGPDLAMIFQDPMTSLNPVMRIGKQIAEPLRLHQRMSRDRAGAVAVELLRSVRIPEPEKRLRQYPHELSGGMRQRVMIAIAVACGPRLVFADEPTTALDVTVQAQILDLLQGMQRERHMAMLLVSHDIGVVATRADRMAVMYAGKIVEIGPTRTVMRGARMRYTEALFQSIPRLDRRTDRLVAIGGRPPSLLHRQHGCRFAPRCAFAQSKCSAAEPPLIASYGDPGHRFACWYPVEVARSADEPAPLLDPSSAATVGSA